jgi:hypothetical protein
VRRPRCIRLTQWRVGEDVRWMSGAHLLEGRGCLVEVEAPDAKLCFLGRRARR